MATHPMESKRKKSAANLDERLLISLDEARPVLGMSRACIYRRISERAIPERVLMRIGGRLYFRKRLLEEWLNEPGPEKVPARASATAAARR